MQSLVPAHVQMFMRIRHTASLAEGTLLLLVLIYAVLVCLLIWICSIIDRVIIVHVVLLVMVAWLAATRCTALGSNFQVQVVLLRLHCLIWLHVLLVWSTVATLPLRAAVGATLSIRRRHWLADITLRLVVVIVATLALAVSARIQVIVAIVLRAGAVAAYLATLAVARVLTILLLLLVRHKISHLDY